MARIRPQPHTTAASARGCVLRVRLRVPECARLAEVLGSLPLGLRFSAQQRVLGDIGGPRSNLTLILDPIFHYAQGGCCVCRRVVHMCVSLLELDRTAAHGAALLRVGLGG